MFDLDLLLDTRLSVLSQIDSALASAIMSDSEKLKKYRGRLNDQFKWLGLGEGVFEHAYKRRNSDALRTARITPFIFELNAIAKQLIGLSIAEPHRAESIEFHINMHCLS